MDGCNHAFPAGEGEVIIEFVLVSVWEYAGARLQGGVEILWVHWLSNITSFGIATNSHHAHVHSRIAVRVRLSNFRVQLSRCSSQS